MAKKEFGNSLKSQMLKMTLIPLVLLTIAITVTSATIVRKSITNQIEEELINDANLLEFVFDEFYVGDYRIEESEDGDSIAIYKGDKRLDDEDTLISKLSEQLDIDVSIFIEDTRILTTLQDDEGNSALGTKSAAVVKNDVLEGGESIFYDNVVVYDERSFAYYKPLVDDHSNIIGMIAVCRSSEDVQREVIKYLLPIILICLFVAILFGVIVLRFNRKLADRIYKMDKYMNRIANGEFDSDMPRELMIEDDEIKSLAYDGRRMAKSLKNLVENDALTGLNNRRSADKRLAEVRLRMVEMGVKYCVCIADIDFFKKVNDTYGHEMGDEVLKMVSESLQKGMKGKGFVARWGGEEFLLIFENRDIDIARRELELIMADIRTIIIPNTQKYVTMSFGLTAMIPGETTDESLNRADANLYEAKESGRNQIICK